MSANEMYDETGKPLARISQIANINDVKPIVFKPEDVEGKDLILHDFEEKKGTFGKYYVLSVEVPNTGEMILVSSGSMGVVAQINNINRKKHLPLTICFKRQGKQWFLD